jgi:DNA-directed RNA polymerase specialized sigma24 family protein
MTLPTKDTAPRSSYPASAASPLTWQSQFPHTSLSEIMRASGGGPEAHDALASLCEKYWSPLYAFLRHRGRSKEDAQDLTQGFFEQLLKRRAFEKFDPSRGKLRYYLLVALKNFETVVYRGQRAQKSGGEYRFVSFEWLQAEAQFGAEPASNDSPDLLYTIGTGQ